MSHTPPRRQTLFCQMLADHHSIPSSHTKINVNAPGYNNPRSLVAARGQDIRAAVRTLAQLLGDEHGPLEWHGPRWQVISHRGGSPETYLDGPAAHSSVEHSEEQPTASWRPQVRDDLRRRESPTRVPPRSTPQDRRTRALRRRDLRWQPSRCPVGLEWKIGARGGLAGMVPEALCMEAPKCQPRSHRRQARSRDSPNQRRQGDRRRLKARERPATVTVDKGAGEKTGPLSRASAESIAVLG